jgi:hypothetical protein
MAETFGTITIDDITFEASCRSRGDLRYQGGFAKCLVIYSGTDKDGNKISGHDYFGDDKFEVIQTSNYIDDMSLYLTFPLSKKEDRYTPENMCKSKILTLKRT